MSSWIGNVFVPIVNVDDVDLERHALVEASAGTGKTYTIENLVVRLLKERSDLQLENILLVTFTEKATGELRQRIRQKIEQALDDASASAPETRVKLQAALAGFDNAAIHTIHGFCHTLLKTFPFETGNLFEQEVVDDAPLMESLLKRQMRQVWPRRYGDRLQTLLALSPLSKNPDEFVQATVRLAQQLTGDPASEQVIPDPATLDVDLLWQTARDTLQSLKSLVGSVPDLSSAYARLNINARSKTAVIRDVVRPIEETMAAIDPQSDGIEEMAPLIAMLAARHSSGVSHIDRLVPQRWLKAGENLPVCPGLVAIKETLERLIALFSQLSHLLMLDSLNQLRKDTASMKAQNGWISYGDMLSRVADFLGGEEAGPGIRAIRERYRVAFVDEFQDTDALQWRIFSTLFLHNEASGPENRLFLIGDPKQAIYSFRGADVFTYLTARRRMKQLAGEGMANLYHLSRNWRSLPSLVACFNRLFSQAEWFGDEQSQDAFAIGYTPVASPPADELPNPVVEDPSGRPPLNIVDLRPAQNHSGARALLNAFICREIDHLVNRAGIRISDNGSTRTLDYRDIAILVRSQAEFAHLEPLLDAAEIPYAYYRRPGLFQSDQAHWLSMVLRAVVQPQDLASVKLALLTSFFDIDADDLLQCPELPDRHPAMRLLADWRRLCNGRRWGALFQSLMEDSGLAFRHCQEPGWNRTQTNFHQLFDYLGAAAYAGNLDAGGMLSQLDSLRRAIAAADGDADVHQIEGEGDNVRIVTMHVSKGLEFPVVFIAGGLTQRHDSSVHCYHTCDAAHPQNGCRRVVDLTASTGAEAALREFEDENKRLYYVAFTRAKLKLYLPYYPDSRNYAWLGPVCGFVSRSVGHALTDSQDAAQHVAWHGSDGLSLDAISSVEHPALRSAPHSALPPAPFLPHQEDFRHRRLSLESFSSLGGRMPQASAMHSPGTAFALNALAIREDDEPPLTVPDLSVAESDPLPGGPQMGSAFHDIFENIDFQAVLNAPANILDNGGIRKCVDDAMARYRIDFQWRGEIARRIAETLRTPLVIDGHRLTLGELTSAQRRHEIEFFFPLSQPSTRRPAATGQPDQMMIRGFIDLIFSWKGRYYIADWKSNRLAAGYDQPAMAEEMRSAGYELQYRLYTIATLRWLSQQLGERFDPLSDFGGVIYVFLRGVAAGDSHGIYHVGRDQLLPVAALQVEIEKAIGAIQW